jgi:hypothetical protein
LTHWRWIGTFLAEGLTVVVNDVLLALCLFARCAVPLRVVVLGAREQLVQDLLGFAGEGAVEFLDGLEGAVVVDRAEFVVGVESGVEVVVGRLVAEPSVGEPAAPGACGCAERRGNGRRGMSDERCVTSGGAGGRGC